METVTLKPVEFESKEGDIKLRKLSFKKGNFNEMCKSDAKLNEGITEEPTCTKRRKIGNLKLQTQFSFERPLSQNSGLEAKGKHSFRPTTSSRKPEISYSPKSIGKLDGAAIKLQKVYKSYRTRRHLADCAVVCEELWWRALDFAALSRCSRSYFDSDKSETAISKWARARTMAAKVGKGLSKDDKGQKLALRHWLEAIDPRHRYGHNLDLYYNVWFHSQSSEPFFYWLDVGEGKEVNLDKCPRTMLQKQCIKYLGPKERAVYEVVVANGKLVYRQSQKLVHTIEGSKWIFVLSTSRTLYIGEKKKGQFQHSSFLAGGATIASGRLVALNGVLDAIWPYSGHYHPTEKNFEEFIGFLKDHNVDLTNVKKYPVDDDVPPSRLVKQVLPIDQSPQGTVGSSKTVLAKGHSKETVGQLGHKVEVPKLEEAKALSRKWTTGAGPRIGCVREYPTELQLEALQRFNLSPRVSYTRLIASKAPIPSPRPSPKIHLSPKLACMGIQSPRIHIAPAN